MLLTRWKDNVQLPAGSTPALREFIGGEDMKCPCRGCDHRTITCHGVCKEYKTWQAYNEDRRKWLQDQTQYMHEGAAKGGIKNIKDRARGWGKRRVKNYD